MAPSAPGARAKKGSELKLSGTTLGTRFAIQMSVALALVMLGAGAFLYQQVLQKAAAIQENAFVEAVQIQGPLQRQAMEDLRREVEGLPPDTNTRVESAMPLQNAEIKAFADGKIQRHEVMYGEKHDKPGFLLPPGKTMPWENPAQPATKVKVVKVRPDIVRKGAMVDLFF